MRPLFPAYNHLAIAARLGQSEWRIALSIGQLQVRFGVDQRVQSGLMARATVAEHNGLDHCRPVQIVDVIERRARIDELPNQAVVSEMRGGDQRGAVLAAGRQLGAGTER